MHWRIESSKIARKINHLKYIDNVKMFAKNQNELETLIQAGSIHNVDIGMEFG